MDDPHVDAQIEERLKDTKTGQELRQMALDLRDDPAERIPVLLEVSGDVTAAPWMTLRRARAAQTGCGPDLSRVPIKIGTARPQAGN
ncbi:MAG: hypothetical protein ACYC91_09355 [Solirubrobacteraceae bacterium]